MPSFFIPSLIMGCSVIIILVLLLRLEIIFFGDRSKGDFVIQSLGVLGSGVGGCLRTELFLIASTVILL